MTKLQLVMLMVTVFNQATTVLSMTSVTLHDVTDTLTPENEKYATGLSVAAAAFKDAEALFNDPNFKSKSGWKKEDESDDGEIVYSKHSDNGKMVTIATVLKGNVDFVMNETWKGVDGLPKWNPNINYAKTIAAPTEHFDILTYGNNDVLVVSGRDFVSGRLYRKVEGGAYVMASRSFELSEYPEVKGKVRAHLYLAAVKFSPHESDPSLTRCEVITLVDLKGMLPKFVINQMLPKLMMMDTEQNKKHFEELSENQPAVSA